MNIVEEILNTADWSEGGGEYDYSSELKCVVCGCKVTNATSIVCSSSLGAITFRYCSKCSSLGAEPDGYQSIVGSYLTYRDNKYKVI